MVLQITDSDKHKRVFFYIDSLKENNNQLNIQYSSIKEYNSGFQ